MNKIILLGNVTRNPKTTRKKCRNIRRQWYGRCWRQGGCISEPEHRYISMSEVSVFFGK